MLSTPYLCARYMRSLMRDIFAAVRHVDIAHEDIHAAAAPPVRDMRAARAGSARC